MLCINKYKNMFIKKNAFTLIEILLVMAVIGILSSVILVGMGAFRKKARVSAALKTAESATAELAYCYLNNNTIVWWANETNGGGTICSGAGEWPSLTAHCQYFGHNEAQHEFSIKCNDNQHTITCNYADGKCEVDYGN